MILKSLYLKNYRTYRGPEEIIFASGDKNITIIQGNNEVGKTTIMNAITWCLYGAELYKNEGNEKKWSRSAEIDLNEGDNDFVDVILTMEDSKGRTIEFTRSLEFYKNDAGKCQEGESDREISIDGMPVAEPDTYISKHLPKKIRKYFLFDGEQLENYFDNNNEDIKEKVFKLSQLNLLERIKTHISSREDEFNDDLESLNPSLGRYVKQEKELITKKEKLEEDLDSIKLNITEWEKCVNDLESQIVKFGENPDALIKEKKELKKDLKSVQKKIKNAESDISSFLIKNFPKILSINDLIKVNDICKDLKEKGFIPSPYKKEFIESLLENHRCICGDHIEEGSDEWNMLKKLYDECDDSTNISDEVNILLGHVEKAINDFPKKFKNDLITKSNTKDELLKTEKEINTQINEIDNRLSEDDEKKVRKLQNDISYYEKLIKQGYTDIGTKTNQIEGIDEKLPTIRNNIKDEKAKAGRKDELDSSIEFCRDVKSLVTEIYNNLKAEIHDKLQQSTSEEFKQMHWKSSEFYEGVSIDQNFNVTIHKQGGDIVPDDLSAGGQLVLALSFMTALNSLSGFELPIIIDTPLGRLDEPIKENIARNLPAYTKNKQVTLLVTSSEYSEGFKKGIRDYVGKYYTLNYKQEKDGMTSINEKI